jgi:hypothetical protein
MSHNRGHLVAALAAAALTGFVGCGDEAAEQEAQDAGQEVEQEAQDAQEKGEQGD